MGDKGNARTGVEMTNSANTVTRRLARGGIALGLALGVMSSSAMAVAASGPVVTPVDSPPIDFPAGSVCSDAVRFENTRLTGTTTTYAPDRRGVTRIVTVGAGASLVTNESNHAKQRFSGWFIFTTVIAADGTARVDAYGTDFIVWYVPGDPSEIGPGLFRVQGHATEWYAADGTLTRASYTGKSTDLCAGVGA
jgi:hypothetical protein